MTSALVPFTFNDTKLFTITINDKPWTRAKEVVSIVELCQKYPKCHIRPCQSRK